MSERKQLEPLSAEEKAPPDRNILERAGLSIEKGSTAEKFKRAGEDIAHGQTAETAARHSESEKEYMARKAGEREEAAAERGTKSTTAPILGMGSEAAESFEKGKMADTARQTGESVSHGKVSQIAGAVGEKIKHAGESVSRMFHREGGRESRTVEAPPGGSVQATVTSTESVEPGQGRATATRSALETAPGNVFPDAVRPSSDSVTGMNTVGPKID